MIELHLISPKGRFNFQATRDGQVKKHGLEKLILSILFHTKFAHEYATLNERSWCIQNDILKYPKCNVCSSDVTKFHCNSYKGYRPYCSQSCANKVGTSKRSPELVAQVARKVVKTRRERDNFPKGSLVNAWTEEARAKRKSTNLKKYGVENAGVLGAYSSNAAYQYIRNFLKENAIPEGNCYFKWGGVNDREFFQCLSVDGRRWYVSYDLVVFKDRLSALNKDMNSIHLILEYNGPWHYTKKQVNEAPNEMATPYPNSKTRMETYLSDKMKIDHIRQFCNSVWIYWERTGKLQKNKMI